MLALKYGVSLAQEYQAELHLLHVLSTEERDQPEDPARCWLRVRQTLE